MPSLPQVAAILRHLEEVVEELRGIRRAVQRPRQARGYGPCDLVTVAQAARILQMGDRDARAFLEVRGLIRNYDGRPRVRVGELVEAHDDAWKKRCERGASPRPRRKRLASWDQLERRA